jgi:hypothetical protein
MMSNLLKRSIWFGRLVLRAGVLLFTQLGLGNIVPVETKARNQSTS